MLRVSCEMFYYTCKYIKSSFFPHASYSPEGRKGEEEQKTHIIISHHNPFHKVGTNSMTIQTESLQEAVEAVGYSTPTHHSYASDVNSVP